MKKFLLFATALFTSVAVNAQVISWDCKTVDGAANLKATITGSTTVEAKDIAHGEGVADPTTTQGTHKIDGGATTVRYYDEGTDVTKWVPVSGESVSRAADESLAAGVSVEFGIEEKDPTKYLDINAISLKIVRFGTDAVRANVKLVGEGDDGAYDSGWLITADNWSALTGSDKEGAWVEEEGFRPARENGADDENEDGFNIITIKKSDIANLPANLYEAKIVVTFGGIANNKAVGLGDVTFALGDSSIPSGDTPAAGETELTLTEGHTLLVSDIEAAGGTDNDIVRFYIVNNSGASREDWGIGGFANSDNWTPKEEWTGVAGDAWTYEYTVAKIKEVAGDAPGQWHGIGITINIYNDCKVDKVTLVKGTTTGIQTVKNVKAEGIRYNLAGQVVDENYKGIVILNGKKMIQK